MFWRVGERKPVYCNEKHFLMHRWLCGTSCPCISFQLIVAAIHHSLHLQYEVWQQDCCNLFSVYQGKRRTPYRHIHCFKLLQFFGHNSVIILVIKNNIIPVLICSADHNFPFLCWFGQFAAKELQQFENSEITWSLTWVSFYNDNNDLVASFILYYHGWY